MHSSQTAPKDGITNNHSVCKASCNVCLSPSQLLPLQGIAKTGSGKTAAFVLPMVVHIMDQPELQKGEGPIGVIVAPTRELAEQIHRETRRFSKPHALQICAAFGGLSKHQQFKELKAGAEVSSGCALLSNEWQPAPCAQCLSVHLGVPQRRWAHAAAACLVSLCSAGLHENAQAVQESRQGPGEQKSGTVMHSLAKSGNQQSIKFKPWAVSSLDTALLRSGVKGCPAFCKLVCLSEGRCGDVCAGIWELVLVRCSPCSRAGIAHEHSAEASRSLLLSTLLQCLKAQLQGSSVPHRLPHCLLFTCRWQSAPLGA